MRAGLALVGHVGDVYEPFDVRLSPAVSLGVGLAIAQSRSSKYWIDLRTYTYYQSFADDRFSDCGHLQVDLMLTAGLLCYAFD